MKIGIVEVGMPEFIQSLGCFVRRSAQPDRLAAFYQEALRLPGLRRSTDSTTFWAGETTGIEIAKGGSAQAAYGDRNQAPCYPVFRVYRLNDLAARLKAAGA